MAKKELSIKEAFEFTGSSLVNNFLYYLGVSLIVIFPPVIFSGLLGFLAIAFGSVVEILGTLIISLSPVLALLFSSMLLIGITDIALKNKAGKDLNFVDFIEKRGLTVNFAVGSLIYGLMVSIGSIFFIVPGIFFAVRFGFFDFIIVDEEVGPITAFKKSFKMTKGYGWSLLLLIALLIPISVFVMLSVFPVGLLICTPLTYLVRVHAYDQIK